jgi:hypothetical protein
MSRNERARSLIGMEVKDDHLVVLAAGHVKYARDLGKKLGSKSGNREVFDAVQTDTNIPMYLLMIL